MLPHSARSFPCPAPPASTPPTPSSLRACVPSHAPCPAPHTTPLPLSAIGAATIRRLVCQSRAAPVSGQASKTRAFPEQAASEGPRITTAQRAIRLLTTCAALSGDGSWGDVLASRASIQLLELLDATEEHEELVIAEALAVLVPPLLSAECVDWVQWSHLGMIHNLVQSNVIFPKPLPFPPHRYFTHRAGPMRVARAYAAYTIIPPRRRSSASSSVRSRRTFSE